jgi:hypothetical protein
MPQFIWRSEYFQIGFESEPEDPTELMYAALEILHDTDVELVLPHSWTLSVFSNAERRWIEMGQYEAISCEAPFIEPEDLFEVRVRDYRWLQGYEQVTHGEMMGGPQLSGECNLQPLDVERLKRNRDWRDYFQNVNYLLGAGR